MRMSHLLVWTLSTFCVAAIVSAVAVLALGCDVTQSDALGALGLAAWIFAIVVVLVLTLLDATKGSWLAGVLGAGALLVGGVCLLVEIAAFKAGGLCGWEWNV